MPRSLRASMYSRIGTGIEIHDFRYRFIENISIVFPRGREKAIGLTAAIFPPNRPSGDGATRNGSMLTPFGPVSTLVVVVERLRNRKMYRYRTLTFWFRYFVCWWTSTTRPPSRFPTSRCTSHVRSVVVETRKGENKTRNSVGCLSYYIPTAVVARTGIRTNAVRV